MPNIPARPHRRAALRHLMAAGLGLLLAAALPVAAQAHRAWLLPSATVLSGSDPWVTVDAAISNDLFFFEHFPLRLDDLAVTGPDGAPVAVENASTGRYRSTFDLHLVEPGTYRIAAAGEGLFASYELNGERHRWRGTAEDLPGAIPEGAEKVRLTRSQRRVETFVTAGRPTEAALAASGQGLELRPVSHPNDLYAGETAEFELLLDGQPAPDVEVEVIPGGIRYRDRLQSMAVRSDAAGRLRITWPQAGMYWLGASVEDDRSGLPDVDRRRAGYAATFEVLPQ
ncbi:DUF4198 domain-containing protein [Marinibaculum pumilum]|uniref:DUF4198 domain-containing protein n=1 Tax=Marinibaculum pumilum TaxID=1766165 RepID=A0ABV7L6N1_9PROT